jgi:ankyrin repeat protein
LLIEDFKADPNFKTTANETPLMAAAKRDKLGVVDYLLDHEADPDMTGLTGLTALDYAILQGNYDCALAIYQKIKTTTIKNPC